jgi:hypothetical protein
MGGECRTNEKQRNTYNITARKPEGKRPLGKPRHWLEDLREI